jgi:hypothetical protein
MSIAFLVKNGKMGNVKYIESPDKMWQLFTDYKNDVKDNPRYESVYGGKDFNKEAKELERPLTMEGFDCFVMNNEGVKSKGIDQYFANQDKLYDNYMGICSRIRREIRRDQIEGGMVGQYNASITQRLNNLVDKQEQTIKQEQPLFGED